MIPIFAYYPMEILHYSKASVQTNQLVFFSLSINVSRYIWTNFEQASVSIFLEIEVIRGGFLVLLWKMW